MTYILLSVISDCGSYNEAQRQKCKEDDLYTERPTTKPPIPEEMYQVESRRVSVLALERQPPDTISF